LRECVEQKSVHNRNADEYLAGPEAAEYRPADLDEMVLGSSQLLAGWFVGPKLLNVCVLAKQGTVTAQVGG
jgi:hypothetical protein